MPDDSGDPSDAELAAGVRTFTPAVGRDDLIRRRLKAVADALCGGSVGPLAMSLTEVGAVSTEVLAALRALVRKPSQHPPTESGVSPGAGGQAAGGVSPRVARPA